MNVPVADQKKRKKKKKEKGGGAVCACGWAGFSGANTRHIFVLFFFCCYIFVGFAFFVCFFL